MTDTPLPKQELLVKLMGMTTAENDHEALAALRRANALLSAAGWDWAKLIHGKITVVADPFAAIADPRPTAPTATTQRTPAPGRPQPMRPRSPPPYDSDQHGWGPVFGGGPSAPPSPPPQAPTSLTNIKGVSVNRFPGFCWCCAQEVIAGRGFVFKPRAHNPYGPDKFMVICAPCEGKGVQCQSSPALATGKRRRSVGDLA